MNINSDYIIYDWVGEDDYIREIFATKKLPTKDFLKGRFEAFSQRLPQARAQLQLLVLDIDLDHSAKSLEQLDAWLVDFIDDYMKKSEQEFPYHRHGYTREEVVGVVSAFGFTPVFLGLTPLLKSVGTDLCIYYAECIQRLFPRFHWIIGDGKSGDWRDAGFPGITSGGELFIANGANVELCLFEIAEYCREGNIHIRIDLPKFSKWYKKVYSYLLENRLLPAEISDEISH